MQVLLTESEFANYVHKARIKQPVEEFVKKLMSIAARSKDPGSPMILVNYHALEEAIQTLNIKLDI